MAPAQEKKQQNSTIKTVDCDSGLRWLSGNIRRKLTLFVVLILIVVIGLFWLFSVYMLQPTYQRSVRGDVAKQVDVVVGILDDAYAQGQPLLEWVADDETGLLEQRVSSEVAWRLQQVLEEGRLDLNDRCLEIANQSLRSVLRAEYLMPGCVLHLAYEADLGPNGVMLQSDSNGEYISRIRSEVLQNGSYESALEDNQYVLGRSAAGGQLSVIMSANHERIPQAVEVLKRLLMPLSLLLGLLSVIAVWVFSRWFTRPLNRLSAAAREMAAGNYNVRVENCGDDEIGVLAKDFNAMAYEVGRSANLQRELLANVSHDLRTPLTLIKGYAETVRDLSGDDKQQRTEQLNVIVDESDRLSALVGSVMELSRMSAGIEKAESLAFDLYDLCDEISYRYKTVEEKKGHVFDFNGDECCLVYSDPKLLERALHNLLGNAVKHTGKDGYVGFSVRKTPHGTARCEVQDHGPGIPPEDLLHVFERYYRSRADSGRPGTGLGLSIAKAIFQALGIRFGVQSELGQGACFWFEAPLDDGEVV